MRTVRDSEGTTYLLLKESADSALVRDPATGDERYVPTTELEFVDGESPLQAAAAAISNPQEPPLSTIADDRALGLVVYLDAHGPQPARALLEIDTLCESDLHGVATELRAAGLLEETRIDGLRGYRTTENATNAMDSLRD